MSPEHAGVDAFNERADPVRGEGLLVLDSIPSSWTRRAISARSTPMPGTASTSSPSFTSFWRNTCAPTMWTRRF